MVSRMGFNVTVDADDSVIAQPAAPSKGGLQTVLDERQLAVTLGLNVVKLLPAK